MENDKNKFDDFEIFDGKKMSELLSDIYKCSKDKRTQIETLIDTMAPLVGNIEDATMLMPVIKDYLDVAVKNDKQLVDLGILIQKLTNNNKKKNDNNDESGMLLTEQEKKDLREEAKILDKQKEEIKENIEEIIKAGENIEN